MGEAPDELSALAAEESQQSSVYLILMSGCDSVRCAGVIDFLRALDEARRFPCLVVHRNDLIVLAVQDESMHIDLPQIAREVGFGKRLDAVVCILQPALHAPEPELIEGSLRDLRAGAVGAVELNGEVPVVL